VNEHRKPSKEELLEELESIRASLLPEGEDKSAKFTSDNSPEVPLSATQKRRAIEQGQIQQHLQGKVSTATLPQSSTPDADPAVNLSNNGNPAAMTKSQSPESTTLSANQQSLFDDSEVPAEQSEDNPAALTKSENPFLPKHMKERLEKEKSLYQQEIDAASPIASVKTANTSLNEEQYKHIVDELVAQYLPQIEQDLRRKLHLQIELLQSEENKTTST